MVAIKRSGIKSEEKKTGFESYDGEEPKKSGLYRAKIVSVKYKRFRQNEEGIQNEGLVVSVILEAAKGDPKKHAQFNGWPTTTNIVFGDKEMLIARESNFYAALGVKDEPSIDVPSKKGDDLERGVKVNKIGGKDPVGLFVSCDLKPDRNPSYDRLVIDGIYKFREGTKFVAADDEEDEEDEDLLEEDDEAEDEEDEDADEADEEYDERAEELAGMTLADLRKAAKALDLVTTGLKKDALVTAILEAEFEDGDEEDDEDEEDEDDEEDDEDGYDEEARREELDDLSRAELKKILKDLDASFTVLKKHSESDLVAQIIQLEQDETPF